MSRIRLNQFQSNPNNNGKAIRIINLQTINDYPPLLTPQDKTLNPVITSIDGDNTGITITRTPLDYVMIFRNAIMRSIGDGVATKDCFFSQEDLYITITAGQASILAARTNGNTWAWGSNSSGQLGDESTINESSPISIHGSHSFNSLAMGNGLSLALKAADGTAWAWGSNSSGQLGDSTTVSKSSPISVLGAHSFGSIACGSANSIGRKTNNGTAWTWGVNGSGQLGDNTTVSKSSPISVLGAHSFNNIAAGSTHFFGIKADNGTAWCWGLGTSGQLGQGTSAVNRSSPVSVVGAHSFTSLATGSSDIHSLALKGSNGSAWAWGSNTPGCLGDNSTTSKSSPVSVVGAHSFISLTFGLNHSMGLKSDGSCWCWGNGSGGANGDNSANDRSSPVSVVGAHSFIAIATAAGIASHALKSDGSIWSWGTNSSGELGDNTTVGKSSPILIVGPYGAPAAFNNINAGYKLIWNSIISGINLAVSDSIDFIYVERDT